MSQCLSNGQSGNGPMGFSEFAGIIFWFIKATFVDLVNNFHDCCSQGSNVLEVAQTCRWYLQRTEWEDQIKVFNDCNTLLYLKLICLFQIHRKRFCFVRWCSCEGDLYNFRWFTKQQSRYVSWGCSLGDYREVISNLQKIESQGFLLSH